MTLFCGFLVLGPSMASTVDGVVRRWVDVFWTAIKPLHSLDPSKIKHVYFGVLVIYAIFGIAMLSLGKPTTLLKIATFIYNFALGFSCWHVLVVNRVLLPRPLQPGWFVRISLVAAGIFFWMIGLVAAAQTMKDLGVL